MILLSVNKHGTSAIIISMSFNFFGRIIFTQFHVKMSELIFRTRIFFIIIGSQKSSIEQDVVNI